MPLRQKGYPTLFWIAFLDSHISRHKSTPFTRTRSSVYTPYPLLGCILTLTQIHTTKALLWPQSLIAFEVVQMYYFTSNNHAEKYWHKR